MLLKRYATYFLHLSIVQAKKNLLLKRIFLDVLKRFPGLLIKLKQIHIRYSLGGDMVTVQSHPHPHLKADNIEESCFHKTTPKLEGVNSSQRTPLEATFYSYGRKK